MHPHRRPRWIVTLPAILTCAFFSNGVAAQQTVPIVLCAVLGPEFQIAHVSVNSPVILEMTDTCTLPQQSGVVTFSTSDTLATLPGTLTYGSADVVVTSGGWLFSHPLLATFTFRSVGAQTLAVTIAGVPAIVPIAVDPAPTVVPALNATCITVLACLLAIVAIRFGHVFISAD